MTAPTFYEMFSGGGMARLAIGDAMKCTLAVDFCPKKAASYRANFDGAPELRVADIATLAAADLPGRPALIWGSPPCVGHSSAGKRAGLRDPRAAVVWPFLRLIAEMVDQGRAPAVVAIENVTELLISRDFAEIVGALADMGFVAGAVEIDAALFLPQSRRRLFIVAVRADADLPQQATQDGPSAPFHTRAITMAHERLAEHLQHAWRWWRLPMPPAREIALADVIQADARGDPRDLARVLELMAPEHRAKVDAAIGSRRPGEIVVGAVNFRGRPIQRPEVRFDLANALRCAKGGSSIQTLIVADDAGVFARKLLPREAARLQGLPESYILPEGIVAAHDLVGDGVCVGAVAWLFQHLLAPLVRASPNANALKSARRVRWLNQLPTVKELRG